MVDTAVTDTVLEDTVDTMVVILIVLTDTVLDTDTSARGLLMPNLRLMLMPPPPPTMDTTAIHTDTVDTMAMDTMDTVMDMDTDTTVKLLLKLQFLKPYFLSYN